MDRLESMAVFVRVAETGSFTAAAKVCGLSPTMVANHVRQLEGRLGARLTHRTTRQQSLTDVGRVFLDDCLDVLARVEAAEDTARERQSQPIGRLRVTATVSLGAHVVMPLVSEYLRHYPGVEVDLRLTDRVIDLVEEGVDLAFRSGELVPASDLVGRPLSPRYRIPCASPSYLEENGRPQAPSDLQQHQCLLFRDGAPRRLWEFVGLPPTPVSGRFIVDNGAALLAAARDGLGIALIADYEAAADIAAGRLERLLPQVPVPPWPLSLVYVADRRMNGKLKSFIEHACDRLG